MEATLKVIISAPELTAALLALAGAAGKAPQPQSAAAPVPPAPAPTQPAGAVHTATVAAAPAVPQPQPQAAQPLPAPVPLSSAPVATAPPVPTTAPTYTLDQISRAGASLVDAGKMEPLLSLLARYGVAAVTQLAPEQYGAFATELRALGAQI